MDQKRGGGAYRHACMSSKLHERSQCGRKYVVFHGPHQWKQRGEDEDGLGRNSVEMQPNCKIDKLETKKGGSGDACVYNKHADICTSC